MTASAVLGTALLLSICLTLNSHLGVAQDNRIPQIAFAVSDESGAMVPYTRIKLDPLPPLPTNSQTLKTNYAGKLTIALPAGEYNVTAEALGFKPETRRIFVRGVSLSIRLALKVGVCFRENENAHVYVWLSNGSSTTWEAHICCEKSFLTHIEVADVYGRRLESGPELFQRKAAEEGRQTVDVCSCSTVLARPPGFCGVVDSGTINNPKSAYRLAPGTYIIKERRSGSDTKLNRPAANDNNTIKGLFIEIEKQPSM